jgi:hypothetical protein
MVRVTTYKRGQLPNGGTGCAEVTEQDSVRLLIALQKVTGGPVVPAELLALQAATAKAALAHASRAISPTKVRSELRALLKSNDSDLSFKLERCDTRTIGFFNQALNFASCDWVPDEGGREVPGPNSKRRALEQALDKAKKAQKRGRKVFDYQIELARTCIRLHDSYKAKGVIDFARIVFDVAGMRHFERKRLEQILTGARKTSAEFN